MQVGVAQVIRVALKKTEKYEGLLRLRAREGYSGELLFLFLPVAGVGAEGVRDAGLRTRWPAVAWGIVDIMGFLRCAGGAAPVMSAAWAQVASTGASAPGQGAIATSWRAFPARLLRG